MILLEVDGHRFAVVKGKSDAPRPIDVDRIARRLEPAQRVKIKPRQIQVFGATRRVKRFEATENSRMQSRVDFRGPATCPQFGQLLVFESRDHKKECNQLSYSVNSYVTPRSG